MKGTCEQQGSNNVSCLFEGQVSEYKGSSKDLLAPTGLSLIWNTNIQGTDIIRPAAHITLMTLRAFAVKFVLEQPLKASTRQEI